MRFFTIPAQGSHLLVRTDSSHILTHLGRGHKSQSFTFSDKATHLVRKVEVEDVGNVGVPLRPNQCLSAHFVDQAESLEGADPSCNCLLVGSGDDLLDWEVADGDQGEGKEDEPVDLFKQACVLKVDC